MYDRSPAAANRPLEESDIVALLEQPKSLTKSPDLVVQVLKRMLVTVRVRTREISDLRRSFDMMSDDRKSANHPVEKGLAAIRTLSEEDLEQVMGVFLAEKLALAEKAQTDAERARAGARSENNRVRFQLSQLLESPDIDDGTSRKVAEILNNLSSVRLSGDDALPIERVDVLLEANRPRRGVVESAASEPAPPAFEVRRPTAQEDVVRRGEDSSLEHLFDAPE